MDSFTRRSFASASKASVRLCDASTCLRFDSGIISFSRLEFRTDVPLALCSSSVICFFSSDATFRARANNKQRRLA